MQLHRCNNFFCIRLEDDVAVMSDESILGHKKKSSKYAFFSLFLYVTNQITTARSKYIHFRLSTYMSTFNLVLTNLPYGSIAMGIGYVS